MINSNCFKGLLLVFLSVSYIGSVFSQTTIDFESTGYSDNENLTSVVTIDGFTFSIHGGTDPSDPAGAGDDIIFDASIQNGTSGLKDDNVDVGGVRMWIIKTSDGSEFQLISLYLQEGGVGASTEGTIAAYKDGSQVGTPVTINFDGSTNYSANIDFSDIDEIRIIATDIFFHVDNLVYGSNSAPVVSNLNGDSYTYYEGGGQTYIDQGTALTITDADSPSDLDGGNLTVTISSGEDAVEDVLSLNTSGSVSLAGSTAGSNVSVSGTVVGTLANNISAGNDLVVNLNSNSTISNVQTLAREITYEDTDINEPTTGARNVRVTVNDGDGGTSSNNDVTITVAGVNDEPSVTASGTDPSYTDGLPAQVLYSSANASTIESAQNLDTLILTITNVYDGSNEILSIDGTDVELTDSNSETTSTNSMTASVSLSGTTATVTIFKAGGITVSTMNTLINSLAYKNTSSSPNTSSRVVTIISLSDTGSSTGSNDSLNDGLSIVSTVTITVVSPPSTQANTLVFSNVGATQINLSWTNGNGAKRTVFIAKQASGTASPIDKITYVANAFFRDGDQIGTSGWYCIYNGTGTSVTAEGLMPDSTYRIMVCEYNGDPLTEKYMTSGASDNPANQQMKSILINEIDADTPGTGDDAEFIELYDGGTGNTPLDGLVLVTFNGSDNNSYDLGGHTNGIDLDGYSTDANGFFILGNSSVSPDIVFTDNNLQNGTDAIALYVASDTIFPDNTPVTSYNLVDAIVYDTDDSDNTTLIDTLTPGQPQVNENSIALGDIRSLQRLPNGSGGQRITSTYAPDFPTLRALNSNQDMKVLGNSIEIVDGDDSPQTADFTDFGDAEIFSGSVTRTFTIENVGHDTLMLNGSTIVSITGTNASDFLVLLDPDTLLAPDSITTFQLVFDPSTAGAKTAEVSIENDDLDENPYNFSVAGNGTTAPEILVLGNFIEISDGDTIPSTIDSTDFGSVPLTGSTNINSFWIKNSGSGSLALSGSPLVEISGTNASDFTVTMQPSASSIASLDSLEFEITFDPSALGLRIADVSISNDDPNESTYNFRIQGQSCTVNALCRDSSVYLDVSGAATAIADSLDNGSSSDCGDVSFSLSQTAFNCNHLGKNIVTLTVTDESNSFATCTATLTVIDTVSPSITCNGDTTVYLDSNCEYSIGDLRFRASASDNCGVDTITQSVVIGTKLSSEGDSELVTITADDGNGNTKSCSFTITADDTISPVITCNADTTVYLDSNCEYSIGDLRFRAAATDNCGVDTITQSVVIGTKLTGDGDSELVTITADDGNGNTNSCSFTISADDTISPVITCNADTMVYLDSNCEYSIGDLRFRATATDNCGIDTITQSVVIGTKLSSEGDSELVTITADDGNGNTKSCSFTVTADDTISPVITCNADTTVYLDSNCEYSIGDLRFRATATDNCGIDTITQSAVIGTKLSSEGDSELVTITADDGNGNTNSCSFTVTADDTISPVITCNGDTTVYLDSNCEYSIGDLRFRAAATDNCGVDTITQSIVFGTKLIGEGDSELVTITADDGNGNTKSCSFTITADDTISPVITCNADTMVYLDSNCEYSIGDLRFRATATDNCGVDTITQSVAFGTKLIGEGDSELVTITADDGNGNTKSCSFAIIAEDHIGPSITCGSDTTVYLDLNGEYLIGDMTYWATAFDNCDSVNLKQSILGNETLTEYGESSTILIVAEDEVGNTNSCTFTITSVDTVKPVAICMDTVQLVLNKFGEALLMEDDVDNGSFDGAGTVELDIDKHVYYCTNLGYNEVTLSISDLAGNIQTCTSVVEVVDIIAPVFDPVEDVHIVLEPGICDTFLTYPQIQAMDVCGIFRYYLLEGFGQDTVYPLGVFNETWIAKDRSGNWDTLSFKVNISTYNAAPELNTIQDIVVNEDPGVLTVHLSGIGPGGDCAPQMVSSVSVISNYNVLIKDISLNYLQGDATATLLLDIAPNKSGTATISVQVMDNGGTDNGGEDTTIKEFTVTVNPLNDSPFVVDTIPDEVLIADHILKKVISSELGVQFDDIDDNNLTIGLALANGNPLPAWMDYSNDTLTASPTRNMIGCYELRATASDASGANASDNFKICVIDWPTGTEEMGSGFELALYPNPTKSIVTIEIKGRQVSEIEVRVLNLAGKEVLRKTFNPREQMQVDMSKHVSGMYFVKIKIDDVEIVRKIILDRR